MLTADAADPANCTLDDGQVIPHDGTLKIGCEVCGCKNGRVRCTKRRDCKVCVCMITHDIIVCMYLWF